MNQVERANLFTKLHIPGDPVILFNIWDAGTARAVQEAGAKALATGSWSVAAAHGFED
ncbi:MAG TPA: isocitrate lyase/phosphoenolpyruvate mutase family protein, partial [Acidobacteriota bacterium]|nr:isocitrate lyase/phosphoenolpyruvate mutase family protein [Acidobacteriota bacterium]